MSRRDYAGGAVATTITSGINATALTIPIAASTGWPSGTNGKFYVVIDRGLATEEKILVLSRSGLNLTVASTGDRGVDGSSAQTHSSGVAIEHVIASPDVDEPNAHINDVATDHHTQYLNTSTAAGNGLSIVGRVLAVNVDGSTLEINGDTLRVKASGITSSHVLDATLATADYADDSVTYAKLQNVSATDRLLGRDTAAAGNAEELTVGGGVEFTGTGGIQRSALTGVVTAPAGSGVTSLGTNTIDTITTNVARGRIASSTDTTSRLVANSAAQFSVPLTITATLQASRRFELQFSCRALASSKAGDNVEVILKEGATQLMATLATIPFDDGNTNGHLLYELDNPSAGSHTYQIYLSLPTGTGTGGYVASATFPATFILRDVGAH